jgi:hypothetical protein
MPELTPSTREAARRIGITETALRKAEQSNRIARKPDGQWDIDKTRRRLVETADPARSPLASGAGADGTPFARLKVAQLALKVEAQRFALDAGGRAGDPLRLSVAAGRHAASGCGKDMGSAIAAERGDGAMLGRSADGILRSHGDPGPHPPAVLHAPSGPDRKGQQQHQQRCHEAAALPGLQVSLGASQRSLAMG